jgi:DNA primase
VKLEQSAIREILARTDIGQLIGAYVQLRKRGNDLVGLCPFHAENTPSFHVHPDRGFFKCFGCGQGGDAIKFVQLLENVPFPEAARVLARRAAIPLADESPEAARVRGEKEQIYAANELAAAFFQRTLRLGPEGAGARAYVERRGFSSATVEAFKLGYAPPGWDGLVRELTANGVDLRIAALAGLVKSGQHGFYDFYRARLMIPTYSTTGEVVAFGGRALDDSEPKYLNTTTTPVYTKGRGLYALNVARRAAAAREALVVVEGYLDCIALHQAGFTNAVASLGTAFTAEQAAEIRKYAERVFLCFDADAAGSAATAKSIDLLGAAGCSTFIVGLPPGDDPDTFVRTQGAAAFQGLLDAALETYGSKFLVDAEIERVLASRVSPQQSAERVAAYFREHIPPADADRLQSHAALRLGVDENHFRRLVRPLAGTHFAPRGPSRHVALAAEPPPLGREILAALVDEPALVAEYAERIGPEVFREARYRDIYRTLCARAAELATTADVYAAFGEDREAVELLVALQKPDRSSKVRFGDSSARRAHLDRVVAGLAEGRLERRWRELDLKIDEAFASGAAVSQEERDEHRLLGEEINQRRAKRLGTK